MDTDDPRILELRRRVQADPASLAFAQLAEELRRMGASDDAVATCRAGLVHHPDNLAARVTLGRALIELDRLDQAFTELTFVLDATPGNLEAIRALAEIYQRRGMMSEALVHYRRALQLAERRTDNPPTVRRTQQAVEPQPPRPAAPLAPPALIEDLFDFDSLLAQLERPSTVPEFVPSKPPAQSPLDTAKPPADDAFAVMERQLREREEQRVLAEKQARHPDIERHRAVVIRELENWLSAIIQDREHPSQPSA